MLNNVFLTTEVLTTSVSRNSIKVYHKVLKEQEGARQIEICKNNIAPKVIFSKN